MHFCGVHFSRLALLCGVIIQRFREVHLLWAFIFHLVVFEVLRDRLDSWMDLRDLFKGLVWVLRRGRWNRLRGCSG